MEVWILKDDGSFEFKYEVPKGAFDDDLLPAVPYMLTAPPQTGEYEKAYGENPGTPDERWVIKPNFAGVQYWMPDGSNHVCNESGIDLPQGATLNEPEAIILVRESKIKKLDDLSKITVTTQSGKTFDGNETARSDMLVALTVGEWIDESSTYWKMANNDTLLVTKEELQEALTLAIQAKGRIVGAIE